ncbi:MAG: transcriptional regulator [Theionarchaea archaeon]|jgi:DNA-binding MarR family transcriptional regulator|nr:transcriptional regulator [Theionarchaea archaeon]
MSPIKDTEDLEPIADIDKLIHEPARLLILAHLYVVNSADFLFLQSQTGLTSGNLSSHVTKLEEAGYVEIEKGYVEKKPHTMLKLTERGRNAFKDYVQSMKQIFNGLSEE